MRFIYKITLFFLFIPLLVTANDDKKKHEKNKVIKKVFSVNPNATVSLNNKYGNLNITTWDKNSVEIAVTITVQGDDLDDVKDKISGIDVIFNANKSFVEAETIIESNKSSWTSWFKSSKNINYKINYDVKMPKTNSVDLDNDYGNIYLDNLDGKANIDCEYGKIAIGNLNATSNVINLDYSNSSTIHYIKKGTINIDYSKLTVDISENIKAVADYSTLKFDKTETIDFNCDYGSISIEEAIDIKGNSDYLTMRFGTVKKNLLINTDYGSISVKNLVKDFENVDINSEYASIRINVDPAVVFDFVIDLQYAGFSRNNDKIDFYKNISKATSKYFEGKFGKGNTKSKMVINSQYGGVSIKEN
ncbi:hypothetical protein [Polaribacter sargassicola]|uniref:hypothetical protein n=1 Tax=Polaribacter sargassicola TaxID=2836891 RepID=UPI001F43AD9D|nr:hypothetical protein [Polaribacter sp. DS7-9]MCG1036861.1 hypothetical protein [Polaribacter sp. DS7-9]